MANAFQNNGGKVLLGGAIVPVSIVDIDAVQIANSYNDGDLIPQLNDFSGNSNHAQQGTVSRQATLALNHINGLPSIAFTEDFYSFSFDIQMSTIFIVYRDGANNDGDMNRDYGHTFLGSDVHAYNFGGYNTVFNLYDFFTGRVAQMAANAGNRVAINGSSYVAANSSGITKSANYRLMIVDMVEPGFFKHIGLQRSNGSSGITSQYFSGNIARLVAYQDRLTDTQIIAKRNELLNLYGL